MIGSAVLVLLCLSWPGFAADTRLDGVRLTMIGMRGKPAGSLGRRGATPQLTVAKHQLRDWVESRLPSLTPRGDTVGFEQKLNSELLEANLLCGSGHAVEQQPCPDLTRSGFLETLTLRWQAGFLILQTGLGIDCGYDHSAYMYSWSTEGWRRVWQTEQNTYTEKDYKPQTLHAVLVSRYNKANDYMVLTLGSESWCSSNWHPVYYRVFHLGPDLQAGPILERAEMAYLAHEPPIQGSVTPSEVLVEFTIGSIDVGVHSRETVRHYELDRGQLKRVDPLTLSPRDFVDEWLTTEWKETAFWSESANRASIRDWHRRLHKTFVHGEFIYPTMHCEKAPDLWQVGIDFSDPPTPIGTEPKGTYFLLRWRPPYRFSMVGVSDHPSAACTEEDREADEGRTLFPVQAWR